MKVVEFTSNYAGYNAGESAGFPDDQANNIVDSGFANHKKAKLGPKPKSVNKRQTKPAKNIIKK